MSSSTPSHFAVPATPGLDVLPVPEASNATEQPVGPSSLASLQSYRDSPSPVFSSMSPPLLPTTSVLAMDVVVSLFPVGWGPQFVLRIVLRDMTGGASTSSQAPGLAFLQSLRWRPVSWSRRASHLTIAFFESSTYRRSCYQKRLECCLHDSSLMCTWLVVSELPRLRVCPGRTRLV